MTLAVALQRYPDVQVDVYEAAAQFTEIGAGVSMWDRTWKIFQELGLENDLDKLACVPLDGRTSMYLFHSVTYDAEVLRLAVACDFRKSDEPDGGSRFLLFERPCTHFIIYSMSVLTHEVFIDGCIRFHRADLLDVLVRRVPKEAAHFGKKLTLYRQQSNGVTLLFADGVTADCDVLVGCDGIRSVVRKEMYEQAWRNGSSIPDIISYINPVWNGTITYRALIPGERLRKEDGSTHRMMTNLTIVRERLIH